MSGGVGRRCGSDPVWVWLWLRRRLVATAPIQPLAWEPPYAAGSALKEKGKKKTPPNFVNIAAQKHLHVHYLI